MEVLINTNNFCILWIQNSKLLIVWKLMKSSREDKQIFGKIFIGITVNKYTDVCTWKHMYTHIHTYNTHTHTYIYIYMCVCVCVCVYLWAPISLGKVTCPALLPLWVNSRTISTLALDLEKQRGTHLYKNIILYLLFFYGDTCVEQERNRREFAHTKSQRQMTSVKILDII